MHRFIDARRSVFSVRCSMFDVRGGVRRSMFQHFTIPIPIGIKAQAAGGRAQRPPPVHSHAKRFFDPGRDRSRAAPHATATAAATPPGSRHLPFPDPGVVASLDPRLPTLRSLPGSKGLTDSPTHRPTDPPAQIGSQMGSDSIAIPSASASMGNRHPAGPRANARDPSLGRRLKKPCPRPPSR